jgi:hypothetical protein
MKKVISVGDFIDHINDLAYDNPDLLNMDLAGLLVYINGYDADPIEILTDEVTA